MIEAVGEVRVVRAQGGGARIEVACSFSGEAVAPGESVAVSGICLTAVPRGEGFAADVSAQTLSRSTLSRARVGTRVNLERSLRLGQRLGGHLVLGHVDTTVRVLGVRPVGGFREVRFELPSALAPEIAEKGSVALDGVSLTVSKLGDAWFEVALIPTTLHETTLSLLRPGVNVNLETDVLAKYVHRALGGERVSLSRLLDGWNDASG